MADQKNHSYISNSKIRKFIFTGLIFTLPVLIIMILIEVLLPQLDFAEKIKNQYLQDNSCEIEILFFGSSQVERAINPEYISKPSINLANSSQRLFEDFELLKRFNNDLPNLKAIVIEITFDKLERDRKETSSIIHHKNLKFYNVNTFARNLKIQDYFLFHSDPAYFSNKIEMYFNEDQEIVYNQYGFDVNKYFGSFPQANFKDSLIKNENIYIQNINNNRAFQENLKILEELITFCNSHNLKLVIYSPPEHVRFRKLRKPKLVSKYEDLIRELKLKHPEIEFYSDTYNPDFLMQDFYNANHLNPDGAKKASQNLNQFLLEKFF